MEFLDCAAAVSLDLRPDKSEDRPSFTYPGPRAGKLMAFLKEKEAVSYDIKKLGINPDSESERERELVNDYGWLGLEIAKYEREKNLFFRREFLEDAPYSFANVLWLSQRDGRLYSQIYSHPDFLVEGGVTIEERDGLTFLGFQRFQDCLAESSGNVVVWYSPADIDRQNYDTGRIYFSFRTDEQLSLSFDIKVLEECFPVLDLLNSLSCVEGTDLFYYLQNPIDTRLSFDEFLNFLAKHSLAENVVYVSHRLEQDPQPARAHRLTEVVEGLKCEAQSGIVRWQLDRMFYFKRRLERFAFEPVAENIADGMARTPLMVAWDYLQPIYKAASQNNGLVFVYGCSASGVKFAGKEFFNSPGGSTNELYTIFDSAYRNRHGHEFLSLSLKEDNSQTVYVKCPFCNWEGELDICKIDSCPGCGRSKDQILDYNETH